jgi:protein-S-isoprenylcysteine O-methyltransferase Ste14
MKLSKKDIAAFVISVISTFGIFVQAYAKGDVSLDEYQTELTVAAVVVLGLLLCLGVIGVIAGVKLRMSKKKAELPVLFTTVGIVFAVIGILVNIAMIYLALNNGDFWGFLSSS